jgi:hexosaminidase
MPKYQRFFPLVAAGVALVASGF